MEDMLDHYSRPCAAGVIRLCMDERPCQLIDDILTPVPMQSGKPRKLDYEYKRMGTCCLFLAYDMDRGQRYTQVYMQRTKKEYALFMRYVLSHYGPDQRFEIVQDNLNTHNAGSFYEHLPLSEAVEMRRRINFRYTPKHASWLNMAEIEFSVVSRQCLDRRIGTLEKLEQEVEQWVRDRNEKAIRIHWSFTVDKAQQTLADHYKKITNKLS